jgi:signal transduction histidine kinase/ActR/RegA family two-component response regulator
VPVERFLGRPMTEVLPAAVAESARIAIDRAFASMGPATFEYDMALPSGNRWFEAIVVPTDQDRVTTVIRDVTDRRVLEAQLRQAQKMEAVGRLSGGIAHDFNNLLTVISTNAELIAGEMPSDLGFADDLAELRAATRRGAEMVAQLLRFSRRDLLNRQPVNPAAVVRDFVAMLRRLLPETVRLELEEDAKPGTVLADSGALEQIVANLCTNARDAMPDGGTLRLECRNTWLDAGYHATHPWVNPGPYICVSVADTGTGMDEVTKQRIFEPFFTTKPAGSGTGLGMAMVYSLMRQHDGMAQVYSELGRGTIVKLYFPAIIDSVQRVDRDLHTDPREIRGGNELILLVEDEPAIRRASRRALQGKGYSTVEAADGEEALEIFRQHSDSISLIISDLVMPKLGGRQLAAALREAGSTVPILFTSGYSPGSGLEEQALPPGVAFLMKPWSLSDLFGRVREMLDPEDVQVR